jgi:hypothetical protein
MSWKALHERENKRELTVEQEQVHMQGTAFSCQWLDNQPRQVIRNIRLFSTEMEDGTTNRLT